MAHPPLLPLFRRSSLSVPRLAETVLLFCLSLLAPFAVLPGPASFLPTPLCLFAALSLIAFLPGYLLSLLLFAGAAPVSIYWLAALSPVASFALLIFDGISFDLFGLPVTAPFLIASQSAWSLIFLLLTLLPPHRVPAQSFLSHRLLKFWQGCDPQMKVASVACAFLALIFAGTLTYALFAPSQETFTELSIDPPPELNLSPASSSFSLAVEVVSHEIGPRQYTLAVSTSMYSSSLPVSLSPGEVYAGQFLLPLDPKSGNELVQAALYLPEDPAPYRKVFLRLQKDSSP